MRGMARIQLAIAGLCAVMALATAAERKPLTVFAAASLAESLQELAASYEKATGTAVKVSFASSGTLARQIDAGADADLFISADQTWMDTLEQHQRLVPGSRHPLLANRLVLIAPSDSAVRVKLGMHAPLVAALGGGRLAVADPDSVPAGRYAQAALTSFDLWTAVEPHLVRAEDVRAALAWVARGEAPLGIVYATDAKVEARVRVVDTFAASSHPPIVYPIARVQGGALTAAAFETYLESAAARAVFAKHGFDTP